MVFGGWPSGLRNRPFRRALPGRETNAFGCPAGDCRADFLGASEAVLAEIWHILAEFGMSSGSHPRGLTCSGLRTQFHARGSPRSWAPAA